MPGNYLRNIITKKFMELSIYNSDILIVDSYFAKKEIESLLKLTNKKIYVVYLGIDDWYFEKVTDGDINVMIAEDRAIQEAVYTSIELDNIKEKVTQGNP